MKKRVEQGEGFVKNLVIRTLKYLDMSIAILPGQFKRVPVEKKRHYRPFFVPWSEETFFTETWESVQTFGTSRVESAYNLYALLLQIMSVEGECWECGVYRGATAKLIAETLDANYIKTNKKSLRLFDTFSGIPERTDKLDDIQIGDLGQTSRTEVEERLGKYIGFDVFIHEGKIPKTFIGLESCKISFLHIDLDMYDSIKATLEWCYDKLSTGAIVLLDDYGRPGTYGAKVAADEFLENKSEHLFSMPTGQAFFIKSNE